MLAALGILLPTGLSPFESSQIDFGLKSMKILAAQRPDGNVCISPFSLQAACTLLRLGANGATAQELGRYLEHGSLSAADMASGAASARSRQESLRAKNVLLIANGLWSADALKPDYTKQAIDKFGAVAQQTKFPDPGLAQINNWARKNTGGRIPKVFERLDPLTEFVIANAVWFKDAWATAFDPGRTHNSMFMVSDKRVAEVPYLYNSKMKYQTVSLPDIDVYQLDMKNAKFLIGLPRKDLTQSLNGDGWKAALSGSLPMVSASTSFRLPKLEFSTDVDLKALLYQMGMRIAIGPSADYSKMTSHKVFVDQAVHKTFLKLDEQGVEAAAVTAISTTRGGPPKGVEINRPFLFAVKADGMLLFTGVVSDPSRT